VSGDELREEIYRQDLESERQVLRLRLLHLADERQDVLAKLEDVEARLAAYRAQDASSGSAVR
jgi:hypothetical protein